MLVSVVTLLLISYVYTNEMVNRQSLKNAYKEQQQSIKLERQRISSEMHDDIGAGIFSISLFAELSSKKRKGIEEIDQIKVMIDELSNKIREIIWTTNVENDNLENLLYYIQFQVTKLFEHTPINLTVDLPNEDLNFNITSHARRNIYLIVKEIGHNTVKHSKATRAELNVYLKDDCLTLIFEDNGIGLDQTKVTGNAMGLKNLQSRIQSLRGQLSIKSDGGTKVTIKLPLSNIILTDIMTTQNRWVSLRSKFLTIVSGIRRWFT